MKDSTLQVLEPILHALRGDSVIEEVDVGAFHLNGRDFIHASGRGLSLQQAPASCRAIKDVRGGLGRRIGSRCQARSR